MTIIIGNALYVIHIITKTNIIINLLLLSIPILFFIIIGIYNKIKKTNILDNTLIATITFFFIGFFIGGCIMGCIILNNYVKAPRDEIELYAGMEEEGKVLTEILATRNPELLTDNFYQRIINFNKQLTLNKEYVNNPNYAPMHWSKDWNKIPYIELNSNI